MKLRLIVALAALVVLSNSAGATITSKKKKTTRQTNPTNHVSSTSRSTSSRRKGQSRTAAHRGAPRQLTPTSDRYKEIQKALADRGYLKTEPTGTWDSASQQAMRNFQSDKKLDPSGKITAASLIGLGLGGKKETQSPASSNTPTAAAPGQSQEMPRATTSPE
jgi:hypothetical protein